MDQTKFSLEIVCPQGSPHQGLGRLLIPNRTFDVKQIPVSLTGVKPEFSILAIAAESAFIFSWGVTMPSALKPPRPPSRNKTVQMVSTTRNESCLRAEKGGKGWRMCNMEQTVHLVPVALLACLLILYICSSAQFHEYEMMGGEMSQNAIETTMMTERHLQQAVSSKSPAEEQIYSTYALEKMSTDLQFHPSDLPITQSMLRGVAT